MAGVASWPAWKDVLLQEELDTLILVVRPQARDGASDWAVIRGPGEALRVFTPTRLGSLVPINAEPQRSFISRTDNAVLGTPLTSRAHLVTLIRISNRLPLPRELPRTSPLIVP